MTKKEIAAKYDIEISMNCISSMIADAIEKIEYEQAQGYDVRKNKKTIIAYAYDMQ